MTELLVDRPVGPAVGATIAAAPHRNYGISERGKAYFHDLWEHRESDTVARHDLIAMAADATSFGEVEKSVTAALASPPGGMVRLPV
jgi:hypothetical protein